MNTINDTIFRLINNLAGSLSFLNPIVIFFAKYAIYVLAIFMIYLWFTKPRMRRALIASVLIFIVAEILAKGLGLLIEHPQPFATLPNVYQLIEKKVGNSFPSDHTVLAFSICTTLFLGSRAKAKPLYLVLAFLVGIGRIWVGVHYPVDVLVGALLGAVSAFLLYFPIVKNKYLRRFVKQYGEFQDKLLKRD